MLLIQVYTRSGTLHWFVVVALLYYIFFYGEHLRMSIESFH